MFFCCVKQEKHSISHEADLEDGGWHAGLCGSCGMSEIVQQVYISAELAFNAHIVNEELKTRRCRGDHGHRKHKRVSLLCDLSAIVTGSTRFSVDSTWYQEKGNTPALTCRLVDLATFRVNTLVSEPNHVF